MKNKRIVTDTSLNSKLVLDMYKSQGLTPYFFNRDFGKDFGLVKITSPLTGREWDKKTKMVFLLTDEEYSKMEPLISNIKEIIELKLKSIETYKDVIPASINGLMGKTDGNEK